MKKRVKKIDFSCTKYGEMADKFYNSGDYLSALRFAYKQLQMYGGSAEIYARLADIYEGMSLNGSALKWWFRYLDVAEEDELPDVYEGIAVNFLNLGNESQAAYYYNRLVDADDMLPEETKFDIAQAFSTRKQDNFRFLYPPRLADYSKEVDAGSRALKAGDCNKAIAEFDKVAKGAKDYASAKEMQAVAYLLAGDSNNAERICNELLEEYPESVRAQATLSAVYMEQGDTEKSYEIAKRLAARQQDDVDDLYKVATVCCENELHEEAYQKFCALYKKLPFDGRMLYFKAVSAYKSGHINEAENALDTLCTAYPDAEVAKYYLKAIRNYKEGVETQKPELIYFYHIPQSEREIRCKELLHISQAPKDEAELFGLIAVHEGYLYWCFDELDGGDHDLQYLAIVTAAHVRADEFLEDILLDPEVMDVLKVEALRMLLERNEENVFGIVLCNIYKRIVLPRINIGRKARKRFIEGFAKIASKFIAIHDSYGYKIKSATETLYRSLEKNGCWDLIKNADDCACAVYLLSELKELGGNISMIAAAFEADEQRVKEALAVVRGESFQKDSEENAEEEKGV
ncbi:MAG: tetratricopeptide repeat protein [Clostridia bacterium]|nr:tetratricopeptide repeat protein [Clostridia bacterium]